MKVEVLTAFVCAKTGAHEKGSTCEMPEGADWIKAGLVKAVKAPAKKKAKAAASKPQ